MFWRKTRDLALLARPFEHSKWLLQVQKYSNKSSKGEKMKSIRKEENLFFGKLLETKKQKTRRLKLETEIKSSEPMTSEVNSEIAWIMNTSKKLDIFNIKSKNTEENVQAKENCSEQQVTMTKNVNMENSVEQVGVESREETTNKLKTKNKKLKNPLLPNVIVQQMLQFPIIEVAKSPEDQWDDNFKILCLSAMEKKSCLKYPSVTKILTATMSDEAKNVLEKWKIKMIEKLGVRGFEIYQSELFEDGKLLHSIIMSFLTEKPYDVPNKIKQSFASLDEVLKHIDHVRAIESHVIHSRLLYRGIIDCIASYRGELCLIDWKKSDKAKNTIGRTYDAPLQLASYIGAVNSDPNYPFQIKKGLIVVAYTTGEPATVHEINEDSLQMYWKLWLQRLQDYHIALNPS